MHTVIHNVSEALGTAIILSLLQGVLIYLLLRIFLLAFGQMRSNHRYNLSATALITLFLWFAGSLFTTLLNQNWETEATSFPSQSQLFFNPDIFRAAPQRLTEFYSISLKTYIPYISVLYAGGLLLQLLRLAWGRQQIARLKQSLITHQALSQQVTQLAKMFNISRPVLAGLSSLVSIPCMAGHIKPLLFLPVTVFSHLSAEEIEAIILHELAHIKRNDYLFNYIQQVIAALLFFNPFAALINRHINTEREYCCDDMVIKLTQKPLAYAHALLKLQETHFNYPFAMAARSTNFKLLNRIQRIMETEKPHNNLRHLVLALVLLTASAFSIAWFNPEFKNGKLTVKLIKRTHTELNPGHLYKTDLKISNKKFSIINNIKKISALNTKDTSRFQDTLLERLANRLEDLDVQRQAVLERPEYRNLVFTLAEKNKIIAEYYSRPEMQEKIKQLPTDHFQLADSLEAAANKLEAVYISNNYAQIERDLMKKHGINKGIDNYTNYKNWKNLKTEWENYKKANLINEGAEMDKASAKLRAYFDSEQLKKENITRAQSDDLHAVYDTPQILQTKKEIAQLKAQIRAMEKSPERQAFSKAIFSLSDSINTHLKSPEFKQRLYTFMKTHPEQIDISQWAH